MNALADRDALALEHMTEAQFEQSMSRWVDLGCPLDQPTLDYIAAIYRELKA